MSVLITCTILFIFFTYESIRTKNKRFLIALIYPIVCVTFYIPIFKIDESKKEMFVFIFMVVFFGSMILYDLITEYRAKKK